MSRESHIGHSIEHENAPELPPITIESVQIAQAGREQQVEGVLSKLPYRIDGKEVYGRWTKMGERWLRTDLTQNEKQELERILNQTPKETPIGKSPTGVDLFENKDSAHRGPFA